MEGRKELIGNVTQASPFYTPPGFPTPLPEPRMLPSNVTGRLRALLPVRRPSLSDVPCTQSVNVFIDGPPIDREEIHSQKNVSTKTKLQRESVRA